VELIEYTWLCAQAKTIEAEHAQYQQRKALGQEVRTAEEAMRNATQQLKEATGKRHEFEVSALEAMAEDSKDRMLESESKLEETTVRALVSYSSATTQTYTCQRTAAHKLAQRMPAHASIHQLTCSTR
jgi:hypothetical protein